MPEENINESVIKGKFLGETFVALAIILLGFILRIVLLGQKSIYVDEAVTIHICTRPINEILPYMMQLREVHPPLYFWMVNLWMNLWYFLTILFYFFTGRVLGAVISYEAFIRLSSALFGGGSVYLTFLIGKKLFDFETGILASFLIAISTFHIYYSQELRMYPMLLFLISVSFYCYLLLLEKPALPAATGLSLSTAAALLTHYYSFYILMVEIFFTLYILVLFKINSKITERPGSENKTKKENLEYVKISNHLENKSINISEEGKKNESQKEHENNFKRVIRDIIKDPVKSKLRLKWIIIPVIISLLPMIWWLQYFLRQTTHQDFTLRINPDFLMFLSLFSRMTYGQNLIHPQILGIDLFVAFSVIPLFLIIYAIIRVKNAGKVFAASWLLIPLGITFAVTFTRFHIFEYKYFFIITPALWILVVESILNLPGKWISRIILIFLILFNAYTKWNYHSSPFYQAQEWRGVVIEVRKLLQKNERIIVHPSMMSLPFLYYFRENELVVPMDRPDISRINQLVKNSTGVWIVTTINHPFVSQAGLLRLFEKNFPGGAIFELRSYNPANVIRVYYFKIPKQDNKDGKTK